MAPPDSFQKPSRPAGKHPTLRPAASSQPNSIPAKRERSPEVAAAVVTKRAKTKSRAAFTSHRVMTRSRSKQFQLLSLPSEIRNRIYEFVTMPDSEQASLNLSTLTFPAALSPCRQVRRESLPVFFAANKFDVAVRSNFCVFNRHLHTDIHIGYRETGWFVWGAIVERAIQTNPRNGIALQLDTIRLRDIKFDIKCVCCVSALTIGSLHLYVDGQTPMVKGTVSSSTQAGGMTKEVLEAMFSRIEQDVLAIGKRDSFNGFSASDLEELAKCFVYLPDEDKGDDNPSTSDDQGL